MPPAATAVTFQFTLGDTVTLLGANANALTLAAQWLLVSLLAALVYWVIALQVYRRRVKRPAAHRAPLFVAIFLVALAGSNIVIADTFAPREPVYFLPIAGFFLLFFYLFPDRRYTPGWTRWMVFLYGLTQIGTLAPSNQQNPQAAQYIAQYHVLFDVLAVVGDTVLVMIVVLGIVPQVYRRFLRLREAGALLPSLRRETRAVAGVALLAASFVALAVAAFFTQSPPRSPSAVFLCARTCFFLLTTLLPVAIGFTLMRRLPLDRPALINRALIYGTLSICLLLIYSATAALQLVYPGLLAYPYIFIFVVIVAPFLAMLFRPLRGQIQDRVERRFFHRKYEAAKVVTAFSGTLREETQLDQLSSGLIAGMQKALQPSAVGLWLRTTSGVAAPRAAGFFAAPPAVVAATTNRARPGGGTGEEIRLHRQAGTATGETSHMALLDVSLDAPTRTTLLGAASGVGLDRLPDSQATRAWRANGMSLVVPLLSEGELIGVVALGAPADATPYTVDERELLGTLAEAVAPALAAAQWQHEQNLLTRERERVEQELQTARRIQEALLPKTVPTLSGWQLATLYQPAREVGGDFYDFLALPDGRLGLVLGDVTDKGMPAALVMATTRSMLRAVGTQHAFSPGQVLAQVNELLCPDLPASMFVTCFYAILDPATGSLRYANAGQDLPYVRRADGGVCELRATGMPLGLMPGVTYEERDAVLAPGDSMLFYSDGLVEAHNPAREMFGFPRLMSLLGGHADGTPPIVYLLNELAAFTGAEWEQEDDITLVTLHRLPKVEGADSRETVAQQGTPDDVTASGKPAQA